MRGSRVTWNPSMDIVAVWSPSSPFLSVYRCANKFQKLFERESVEGPTVRSFAFQGGDGRYCVIGYADGRIEVVAVENAEEVYQW